MSKHQTHEEVKTLFDCHFHFQQQMALLSDAQRQLQMWARRPFCICNQFQSEPHARHGKEALRATTLLKMAKTKTKHALRTTALINCSKRLGVSKAVKMSTRVFRSRGTRRLHIQREVPSSDNASAVHVTFTAFAFVLMNPPRSLTAPRYFLLAEVSRLHLILSSFRQEQLLQIASCHFMSRIGL